MDFKGIGEAARETGVAFLPVIPMMAGNGMFSAARREIDIAVRSGLTPEQTVEHVNSLANIPFSVKKIATSEFLALQNQDSDEAGQNVREKTQGDFEG